MLEALGFSRDDYIVGMDFPANSLLSYYLPEEVVAITVRCGSRSESQAGDGGRLRQLPLYSPREGGYQRQGGAPVGAMEPRARRSKPKRCGAGRRGVVTSLPHRASSVAARGCLGCCLASGRYHRHLLRASAPHPTDDRAAEI